MSVTSKLSTTDSKLNVEMKLAALTAAYSRSNSLTISQMLSYSANGDQNISQSLVISQTVSRVLTASRSLSNSLTITQAYTELMATGKLGIVDSKLGYTERLGGVVDDAFAPTIGNSLVISQSVQVAQPFQSVSQSLSLTQSVSHANDLSLSASNSLAIIQVADQSKFKPRSVSNSLIISQTADELQTLGLTNSLTITQTPAYEYDPHSELSTQNFTLLQTAVVAAIFNRSVNQTLTIVQTIVKTKIITRSVSQSLALSSSGVTAGQSNINQTLTVAQIVAHTTFRNNPIATQSLVITQSVVVRLTLNLSAANTLVFSREHLVPNGAGGFFNIPNLLYAKGTSVEGPCDCQVNTGTTTYQGLSRAIILPNPEFGDGENPIGAVRIIRTITGGTFTYVKKSVNRKLKYKFHINQKKAYELRQFLLDFLTQRVTLTNWKGEIWSGNFLSDPAEITSIVRGEPCVGDLYEVELDFQGIRIN